MKKSEAIKKLNGFNLTIKETLIILEALSVDVNNFGYGIDSTELAESIVLYFNRSFAISFSSDKTTRKLRAINEIQKYFLEKME